MALLCVALPMVSFFEAVSRSGLLRKALLQGSWQANLSWQVGSLWQFACRGGWWKTTFNEL